MLWNKRILFIHVPKTGGMSLTYFLESVLEPPVFNSVPEGHEDPNSKSTFVKGMRHERIHETLPILSRHGFSLDSFEAILIPIRNPYELEISRYHHILKHFKDSSLRNVELIKKGGLEEFVKNSNFYGKNPPEIEEYYTLNGILLNNVKILRNESLQSDLSAALSGIYHIQNKKLDTLNTTKHKQWKSYMTPSIEESIYQRFKWIFDMGYYERFC